MMNYEQQANIVYWMHIGAIVAFVASFILTIILFIIYVIIYVILRFTLLKDVPWEWKFKPSSSAENFMNSIYSPNLKLRQFI